MKDNDNKNQTHFGYQSVSFEEKAKKVREVFSSVAQNYDIMNDLMSLGVHRYWKRFAVKLAAVRPGQSVLDVAAGTCDVSLLLAKQMKGEGSLIVSDINESMLALGREKCIDEGFIQGMAFVQADAEHLPFKENHFDCITIAFGLRNVTHKENALRDFYRVLKPGGKLIILEFSKPVLPFISKMYDQYSFSILPVLGKWIAKDEASYRYLAESIRKHPDQLTLKSMCLESGFDEVLVHNLSSGIVAIHEGYKY